MRPYPAELSRFLAEQNKCQIDPMSKAERLKDFIRALLGHQH